MVVDEKWRWFVRNICKRYYHEYHRVFKTRHFRRTLVIVMAERISRATVYRLIKQWVEETDQRVYFDDDWKIPDTLIRDGDLEFLGQKFSDLTEEEKIDAHKYLKKKHHVSRMYNREAQYFARNFHLLTPKIMHAELTRQGIEICLRTVKNHFTFLGASTRQCVFDLKFKVPINTVMPLLPIPTAPSSMLHPNNPKHNLQYSVILDEFSICCKHGDKIMVWDGIQLPTDEMPKYFLENHKHWSKDFKLNCDTSQYGFYPHWRRSAVKPIIQERGYGIINSWSKEQKPTVLFLAFFLYFVYVFHFCFQAEDWVWRVKRTDRDYFQMIETPPEAEEMGEDGWPIKKQPQRIWKL
jgi:hypothetical protein